MVRFLCWLKINSIALKLEYLKHWLTWKYVMKNLMRLLGRKKIWEDEIGRDECQWKTREYEIKQFEFQKNDEFVNNLWVWLKIFFYFFCIYKMYLISADGYKNAGVDLLIIKKRLVKFGQKWKTYKMV